MLVRTPIPNAFADTQPSILPVPVDTSKRPVGSADASSTGSKAPRGAGPGGVRRAVARALFPLIRPWSSQRADAAAAGDPSGPTESVAPAARQVRLRVVGVMGADGSGRARLSAVLRLLDDSPAGRSLQVHLICGPSHSLRATMAALARNLLRLKLRVHGVATDLPKFYAKADLVLLRASPMGLAEALSVATPLVIFDWPEGEEAGARWVQVLGRGHVSRDPAEVAQAIVAATSDHGQLLARWAAAGRGTASSDPSPLGGHGRSHPQLQSVPR